MNSLKGNMDLPDKSFLLSFDDGHREVVEVIAPILKRRSIPAVFFLNSAFIDNKDMSFRYKASLIIDKLETIMQPEVINKLSTIVQVQESTLLNIKTAILGVKYQDRHLLDDAAQVLQIDFNKYLQEKQPYMTSNEIRNLIDQGFMIGSHSVDHPLFCDIQLDEQLNQVLTSLGKLKEQFAITYNAFSFPYTDAGVVKEFYDQTHYNGIIDISFGTSDFSKGYCANNLQRQPMEGRAYHADLIYKGLLSQEIFTTLEQKLHLV
jgi:peptidoglycan/xylan/chitin deacetylase (PgdA/CDA1 family)